MGAGLCRRRASAGLPVKEVELDLQLCAECGSKGSKRCGICRSVYYCSQECQRKHWRVHRPTCRAAPSCAPLCGQGFRRWLEDNRQWRSRPELPSVTGVGFTNCRNNCYLNAVYQCLLHTPLLRDHVPSACLHTKDMWLAEFAGLYRLVDEARRRRAGYVDPPRILSRLIAEASDEFTLGRQADAHEVLILLITKLVEGCLASGDGTRADCSKLGYPEKEQLEANSLIGHVFGQISGQTTSCASCPYESHIGRVEYFVCLNVTMGMTQEELRACREESQAQLQAWRRWPSRSSGSGSSVSPATLEGLLDEYTRREHIPDFRCEKCKQSGGHRSAYLKRRPNVLMVYLDRRQDSQLFGKINRRVVFPERLDIAPWMHRPEPSDPEEEEAGQAESTSYSLYAMCVHHDLRGSTASGHYVAYVRDRGGDWIHLDDADVTNVSWSDVQEQHPYILFYIADAPLFPLQCRPPPPSPKRAPAPAPAQLAPEPAAPPTLQPAASAGGQEPASSAGAAAACAAEAAGNATPLEGQQSAAVSEPTPPAEEPVAHGVEAAEVTCSSSPEDGVADDGDVCHEEPAGEGDDAEQGADSLQAESEPLLGRPARLQAKVMA